MALKALFKNLVRQAKKRPALSLLNLLGLAIGIATCTLIFLYAWSEMNFDSWVPNQDNLYRVEGHFVQSASAFVSSTQVPLRNELLVEGSIFEDANRKRINTWPVMNGDFVNFEDVNLVDKGFLNMFPLNFISGSSETAFATNNNIILNQSMAQKYFGEVDPIGKTLTVNSNLEYTVSAVFEDIPSRSEINVSILIPLRESMLFNAESWNNISLETFVKLKPGVTISEANAKLAQLVDKHRPFMGESPGDMKTIFRLFVQPFGDIHLGSSGRNGADSIGNYGMIYGFIAIALLVLIISAFNYISLSTARSLEREKEICIRKVMGAERGQIIKQVMSESITITIIASLLALLILTDTLPLFSEAMDREFSLEDIYQPSIMATFIFGTLLLGVLSGLYPAFFVSSFRPAKYLSSGKSKRAGLNKLRTGLVFVQFTVCIGLVIGAFAISRQIGYINILDMGFDQENLIVVRDLTREETKSRAETLKEAVNKIPGVVAVTRSNIVPLDGSTDMEGFYNKDIPREENKSMRQIPIDYDFFETYGSTMIAGRQLSEQFANDTTTMEENEKWEEGDGVGNVIISKRATEVMGYSSPEVAIGEQILLWQQDGGAQPLIIVGVVNDIKFNSARSQTQAIIYYNEPQSLNNMTIRAKEGASDEVLRELNKIWKNLFPITPIRVEYLEETIEATYSTENQQFRLFLFFAGLTLILSIVGLIGLVMNSVTHRKKEISIRRVVGASVADIIKLFTWDYLKPVLLANIPAWAITWYFLGEWISQYTQRVDLGLGLYLTGGGVILMVTMIVVTLLVTKSALTPPVYALRHD